MNGIVNGITRCGTYNLLSVILSNGARFMVRDPRKQYAIGDYIWFTQVNFGTEVFYQAQ